MGNQLTIDPRRGFGAERDVDRLKHLFEIIAKSEDGLDVTA
jgi:hypothetical protein